ncbi:hypothetical protein EDC63_101564 [Sulfurirhabdus autotrophica]|uniref:Uncharacterized protein n=1 Tax=Sulfurirhabdus autotrophica TaxID=1706046 RepID=A0A4R3YET0_9PROT|nr:hypothetical protein EDC63_101564 [Sulfurirhabdus autotrophica]
MSPSEFFRTACHLVQLTDQFFANQTDQLHRLFYINYYLLNNFRKMVEVFTLDPTP